MLIKLMIIIISQYIHVSNHYLVDLKLRQCCDQWYLNKAEREKNGCQASEKWGKSGEGGQGCQKCPGLFYPTSYTHRLLQRLPALLSCCPPTRQARPGLWDST